MSAVAEKIKKEKLHALCAKIGVLAPKLSFTILEIGSAPVGGQAERFHILTEYFEGTRIVAFEVDEQQCQQLNDQAPPGIRYYPVALAGEPGERTFYETNHPMCGSLYPPDDELLNEYNALEVSLLKSTSIVTTETIDAFTNKNSISDIDFVKIDVQGAELEIFEGGVRALQDVVFVVSEVEFIPLYKGQPLFGDVCKYLSRHDLEFHKFLNMNGRTLKPLVLDKNPTFATQYMWSDAVFIRNVRKLKPLSAEKLLKLGILAFLYGSHDVAYRCFEMYDERKDTGLAKEMLSL